MNMSPDAADAWSSAASMLEVSVAAPRLWYSNQRVMVNAVPEISVDGRIAARGWGRWQLPVPPGPHRIDVCILWAGHVKYPCSLDVVVEPGRQLPVWYRLRSMRSPLLTTTPVRDSSGCAFRLVVMLLGLVALMLFALLIFAALHP
ncbi:hypothetical protein K7711_46720 [Nocardia sp. CA2R105]|uniref:hypothetical protein n=1 Tax=Nocardia coffeae TaxID=2873381 RepID=UPI001CA744CF|nr:hypothetical protein [Nocardia coffeae]MBY8864027.1 hypothetical protein [Nocardia coffeae]